MAKKKIKPSAYPQPWQQTLATNPPSTKGVKSQAAKAGTQNIKAYGVPGDLSAINASIANAQRPKPPQTAQGGLLGNLGQALQAPPPVAAPPPAAPEDDLASILASQNALSGSTDYQGPDLSGALGVLQGAQGAVQPPTSILGDLTDLLGKAPTLPTMDVNAEAQRQIDLKYGGQEAALANQLKQLAAQYAQGQQEQTLYGQKADTALGNIFSALQSDLGAGQGRLGGFFDQASKQSGASYDKASQALQSLNQGIMSQAGDYAKNLGIQEGMTAGGANGPLARLLGNYQDMAGRNIQGQAVSADALSQNKANALNLMETQRTGAERQGAQARSDVQSNVQQALAQLGLENQRNVGNVNAQQTELARQKPLDLQGIVQQLTQQQYGNQRQEYLDRLDQMTKLGGLDIQNQQNQISGQKNQVDLQTALANMMADQAKAGADYQLKTQDQRLKYNNPLDNLLKVAQIQNYGTTGALTQARTGDILNPQPKPTDATRYENLLQDFLHTPTEGLWGAGGAGPKFQDAITSQIAAADRMAATGTVKDPYQWAVQNLINPNYEGAKKGQTAADLIKKYGLNQQGLMDALRIYFKGGR